MNYHIEAKSSKKWQRIASFETVIDRDDCLSFLQERYEDVPMRAVDDD